MAGTCKKYPSRLLVPHSSFFHLNICHPFRWSNAQYLKLQNLKSYFMQTFSASLFLRFCRCPSITEAGQLIDPFEAMSHQSPSSSFLQCYCECRLNKQRMRLEVGAQGTMSGFSCFDCIFNNQGKAPKNHSALLTLECNDV